MATLAFGGHLTKFAMSSDAQELKLAIREFELKTDIKLAETKAELIRWVVAVGPITDQLYCGDVV